MFFKRKQDKIRRCPEGHILDPSWTHCPYCEEQSSAGTPAAELAPPPSYAPPPAGSPSAPSPPPPPPARHLDDNLDKTVVNPRVAPPPLAASPPAPPPPPPPAPLPPHVTRQAPATDELEDDPDVTTVRRPQAAMPPPAAPPPPSYAPPPLAPAAPPPPAPSPAPPPGAEDVTSVLQAPRTPRTLVAWLVVVDGDYRGRDFRLGGAHLRIGIAPDCDIALPDESYISRHHAELELVDGDYQLKDLGSRNGTYVNEQRVDTQLLRDGDSVRLGLTHMIYKTLLI